MSQGFETYTEQTPQQDSVDSNKRPGRFFSTPPEVDECVQIQNKIFEIRRKLGTCNPNNPQFHELCAEQVRLAQQLAPSEPPENQ